MAQSGGTNHMQCVFVESNIETRLGLPLHDQDDVSTLKEKICEEHFRCFPNFGDIKISALKVKQSGQYYHLADSVILTKAFQGNDKLIHVDVLCVKDKGQATSSNPQLLESKPYDPNLEGCLTLTQQVADKETKKRKCKSHVSEKISRRKLKVDPNQSCDSLAVGKDIESGEGNVNKLGEKQQNCDADLKEPVVVEDNQKLDEDLVGAMKQDLNVGVAIVPAAAATTDLLSIDQEKDLADVVNKIQEDAFLSVAMEKENEMGQKEDGAKDADEAKSLKAKKKSKSKKAKNVVVALVASDAQNVEASDNVFKDVNKSQEDESLSGAMEKAPAAADNVLTAETLKSTDAEKEGLNDRVDADSVSIPSSTENEMRTKKNNDKDAAVKARKKSKSKIAKTVVKEETQVAPRAQNVEPDVVMEDSQENVEFFVKRSSNRLRKKQVVEEA